ncbi:hypothetical protein [Mucilaginibacter jinjuensis]|uniref:Uncharacterized protein n=1 Tax=Mucilaginibacter jinjuensis TaxID=1176721 RepID=A0ABY7T9Y5_9SPHI|nr:hypothetical protein [Mucilaginibacter jinjuensis]WCT12925.1 hypothetical protein PQO05_03125 [Mucilaginibacter jinjuensis]
MAVAATFRANKSFSIVGIGLVLTGDIINGEISVGNLIKVVDNNITAIYEIDAVEYVDYSGPQQSEIGLIIKVIDPSLEIDLNSISGKTITVFDKL